MNMRAKRTLTPRHQGFQAQYVNKSIYLQEIYTY
jgi:hypothetical protein